jgi:acyl carrier protein
MNIQRSDEFIKQQIKQALMEELGEELERFDENVPLKDIYGLRYDSMSVVACVGVIEEKIGVEIDLLDDDLVRTFESVTTIYELVQKKLADQRLLFATSDSAERGV